jgi:hypothetical protein
VREGVPVAVPEPDRVAVWVGVCVGDAVRVVDAVLEEDVPNVDVPVDVGVAVILPV